MMQKKTLLIGIAGGSGSGKTTICRQLSESLDGLANLISCDSYYISHSHLSEDERAQVNFDHPQTVDFDLLDVHLDSLARGKPIEMPTYCFATHSRLAKTITIQPRPITIVEGILLYTHESVRNKLNLRVFVEASDEIRFQRRMQRDVAERGRTTESVTQQWQSTVAPMYEKFVDDSRAWSHVSINTEINQEECDLAVQELANGLRQMVTS